MVYKFGDSDKQSEVNKPNTKPLSRSSQAAMTYLDRKFVDNVNSVSNNGQLDPGDGVLLPKSQDPPQSVIRDTALYYNKITADSIKKTLVKDGIPYTSRSLMSGLSARNDVFWSLKLEPFELAKSYIPENPFTKYGGWMPCVQYQVDEYQIELAPYNLTPDLGIEIVNNIKYLRNLTFDVMESSEVSQKFFNYIQSYSEAILQDWSYVLPYKNSCTKITIFLFESPMNLFYKKSYLCIPKLMHRHQGMSQGTFNPHHMEWTIVGEISGKTTHKKF